MSVRIARSPSTFVRYVFCPPNPFTANEIVYSAANPQYAIQMQIIVCISFILSNSIENVAENKQKLAKTFDFAKISYICAVKI